MHAWKGSERVHSKLKLRAGLLRGLILGAAVAGIGCATAAFAGFTTVNIDSGENPTQAQILDQVYGGAFTLEDGVDYSNGTLTAVRVSDTTPQTGGLGYANPGPNAADQLWESGGAVTAKVVESQAEDASSPFGYFLGGSGGTFTSLFSITGNNSPYGVTGSGSFNPGSQVFRFAVDNKFGYMSSLPSQNVDGNDHMVTYEIDGLTGTDKTWLLFFNDYGDNGTDAQYQYQNLAVQIQDVPASVVPEPGGLMILGGVGLAVLKRRSRRVVG
jgi:hypothetical protein